ncbi:MAG: methylated-DNA--[protein]-cysteine S-methyltransferase [Polyangiaceae bacterium]|nr:methylated-DNA--[protein]-cysteine S-methyltransferase [Polyangiaceae bacterium]
MPGAIHTLRYDSPLGPLGLLADAEALVALELPRTFPAAHRSSTPPRAPSVLRRAARQLDEYFAGRRRDFDLPLRADGTEFQRRVWGALSRIPWGETRSYADVARAIGQPTATRAVGLANGRNPLAILVPCHRVIGSDGSLTGFGGGLALKRWLLAHEGVRVAR